jgi:hypothetical protein
LYFKYKGPPPENGRLLSAAKTWMKAKNLQPWLMLRGLPWNLTTATGQTSNHRREADRRFIFSGRLKPELRARIGLLGRRTDEPVIMVTHAVTMSAISGTSAGSGDAILLDLNGTGSPDFAERVIIR